MHCAEGTPQPTTKCASLGDTKSIVNISGNTPDSSSVLVKAAGEEENNKRGRSTNKRCIHVVSKRAETFQDKMGRTLVFKVLVIGDPTTGKTSLVRRYVSGLFMRDYKATLGGKYYIFSNILS